MGSYHLCPQADVWTLVIGAVINPGVAVGVLYLEVVGVSCGVLPFSVNPQAGCRVPVDNLFTSSSVHKFE